jgi:hypothetical protein
MCTLLDLVQIGGSRRQFHRFDTCVRQHYQKLLRVQRIAIMNQIPLSLEEAIDLWVANSKLAQNSRL